MNSPPTPTSTLRLPSPAVPLPAAKLSPQTKSSTRSRRSSVGTFVASIRSSATSGSMKIVQKIFGRFATGKRHENGRGSIRVERASANDEVKRRTEALLESTKPKSFWPKRIPLLEDGVLEAVIYHHTIPSSTPMDCWTYLSNGLNKVGQKEILFTVRRRPDETEEQYPSDPITWFELVYSLGYVIQEYNHTEFRSSTLFDRDSFKMVLYAPPLDIPGLVADVLPGERLHAIILTDEEAEVAEKHGKMRVVAQLGLTSQEFPLPVYIDRDRDSCVRPFDMSTSVRGTTIRICPVWGL